MIPLRSSEQVYTRTIATGALIAINVVIFLYQSVLSTSALNEFVTEFGIVPDQFHPVTLATSMFLHGGWMHLLGNMLFLWVFGRKIEDLIGSSKFVGFYLLGGLTAAVVHVIANPYSRVPTIGASGAIAAVMGAYLIKFPRSKIVTLVPLFVFVTTMELPAYLLLLYWFGIQFLSGVGSLAQVDYTGGGIAWFAHIGGFLAGMALIRLFPPKKRFRAWYDEE